MCPERTRFVRGDTAPECDLCGKQDGVKGCLEAVNFKRFVDKMGAVLSGSSDILVLGQNVLAMSLGLSSPRSSTLSTTPRSSCPDSRKPWFSNGKASMLPNRARHM